MATTYKEGQVIQDDGVVRPVPEAPVTVTVGETSAPEPVPEQVLVTPVKPKVMRAPKAQPKPKTLGKHKR